MALDHQFLDLAPGKKLFFASDFHLGIPSAEESLVREKKIITWLDQIQDQAAAIILVGDIFDFWFEYKHVIPKSFIRFQGKIAQLVDRGIPLIFFTGNHDMWMFDYFTNELGIPVYRKPVVFQTGDCKIYVGHGDGLGPGDYSYKFLKKFFASPFCQWLFRWLHPDIGFAVAKFWSSKSRLGGAKKDFSFKGEKEWLYQYANEVNRTDPHDFYLFGHRHLPYTMNGENFKCINLGEWFSHFTYATFDGKEMNLLKFEK